MGSLQTTHDWTKDFSLVKAKGQLTIQNFLDWIDAYYPNGVTQVILWDFTEADLSTLTSNQARKIAQKARTGNITRRGGKSALVFSSDLGFGMGRMFETISEIENVAVQYKSFKDLDRAMEWLGI